MIELQHLHKFFNRGKQNEIHVINDVSLQLPERGMVAIFGRSGCGKTTLLNVLGGLDTYASGSLTLDGVSMRTGADELRNRYVGYIFQNYNLQKDVSNFENVAVALRLCGMTDEEEIERRVMAALTAVDMARFRFRTPDTLSGGQQQRIAIARAIVKNPAVILADEPTGNLDEANTLLIMDLLHALARDHLVVLVTHESNLVDHYCDRVIELSDGCVVGERINANANGMVTRSKNDIYLGELEKDEGQTAGVAVEYYGEKPENPIRLRIIKREGQTYLQVETPGVRVLDCGSEMQVHEGVFNESRSEAEDSAAKGMDLSLLTPVEGQNCGRLFRFGYSVKSGFQTLFAKKKGKKLLLTCMTLFSMVAVVMTAVLGTGIRDMLKVNDYCHPNILYVRVANDEIAEKLTDALGDDASGIACLQYLKYGYRQNRNVELDVNLFESFGESSFIFSSNLLDCRLAKDFPLLTGSTNQPGRGEIVLSSRSADTLLGEVNVGYVRDYADLLGLQLTVNYLTFRIVGVVQDGTPALYLDPLDLAGIQVTDRDLNIAPASERNMTVASGEVYWVEKDYDGYYDEKGAWVESKNVNVPETVTICGKSFRVAGTVKNYVPGQYTDWLVAEKKADKTVYDFDAWYEANREKLATQDYETCYETQIFAWMEQYYAYAPEFYEAIKQNNLLGAIVFAGAKGSMAVICSYDSPGYVDPALFYYAYTHKSADGGYMTVTEAHAACPNPGSVLDSACTFDEEMSYDEFYAHVRTIGFNSNEARCILSDEDYLDVATRVGSCSPNTIGRYSSTEYDYLAVYSADVEKTLSWIAANVGEVPDFENGYCPGIISPEGLKKLELSDKWADILASLISIAVLLGILCLCMYFIMRSALMSRIREVGIWRAIGVSRKNLLYRFFLESLVTATMTMAVGFFLVSDVVYAMFMSNSLMSNFVYYPVWLAGLLLALLYTVCVLCGTLPVLSLLSRTPSEILAKYDI